MKRRNLKNLKVNLEGSVDPSEEAMRPLSEQLSGLEVGVEYQISLRPEDLEVQEELGSGAGGTVSRVIHRPSGLVMARKV